MSLRNSESGATVLPDTELAASLGPVTTAIRLFPVKPVRIEFFKPERRRYRSVLHRRDGLQIELDGGGYNKVGGPARELPHDLAHFVVEDGLGLEAGLWGVLAAGGMFGHAKVIAGRRAPHFAKRAQAVVDAAGDRLSQAEMLTRFVCDLALDGAERDVRRLQASAGERWWRETSAEQLESDVRGAARDERPLARPARRRGADGLLAPAAALTCVAALSLSGSAESHVRPAARRTRQPVGRETVIGEPTASDRWLGVASRSHAHSGP